jgi:L-threonylcarbamoyladenylate synthase
LLTRKLLRLARVPLAAPSANLFGYVSPTSAAHVLDGLSGKIPHVLDGGNSSVGVESTILDLTNPAKPNILRPGSITATELEKALHVKVHRYAGKNTAKATAGLLAPGMLSQHYSPRTPLLIKAHLTDLPADVGGIFLRKPRTPTAPNVYWLSARASLKEIAHDLYGVLRAADRAGHREIWIEALPENSGELAITINDRIRRAATKVSSRSRKRTR